MDTAEEAVRYTEIGKAAVRMKDAQSDLRAVKRWLRVYLDQLKDVSGSANEALGLRGEDFYESPLIPRVRTLGDSPGGPCAVDFSKIASLMECQAKICLAVHLNDEIAGLTKQMEGFGA